VLVKGKGLFIWLRNKIQIKSIITKIRNKLGHDKFIHPAARIIVENEKGDILFIDRKDNGSLGLPAGQHIPIVHQGP
jgi:hypothetical protein